MLAKSIAGAFLATLWGLLTANLVYLPLAGKLKKKSDEEAHFKYMQMQGIISIHAGENPHIVREKLSVFLNPSTVKGEAELESKEKAPAGAQQKARA